MTAAPRRRSPYLYFLCSMNSGFETRMLRGVGRYLREQRPGWQLRWGSTCPALDPGADHRPDGILFFAAPPEAIERIRGSGLPAVSTSTRSIGSGIPCVVTDDAAIGALAARHFQDRFYGSFAYVGPSDIGFSRAREAAFRAALGKAACATFWMDVTRGWKDLHRRMREFLAGLPKPTGLLTANDLFASRVCEEVVLIGRGVPEEIAILGVDADEMISFAAPVSLASVDSNPEEIGYRACARLAAFLENPEPRSRRRGTATVERVPPRGVVAAASTDTLAIGDPLIRKAAAVIAERAVAGIGVAEVARACACGRRTLEMRFRKLTGQSIADRIRRVKLHRACELLAETRLPVYAVAERAGFASPYYFCDAFRAATGMTPLAWRRSRCPPS